MTTFQHDYPNDNLGGNLDVNIIQMATPNGSSEDKHQMITQLTTKDDNLYNIPDYNQKATADENIR
jgi:hypothetical protein